MEICCFLLLPFLILAPTCICGEDFSWAARDSNNHKRLKREWIWNKMHISEELNVTLPHHVGKITSTIKNPNAKYVLEGEGAGTLFRVDDRTGDVAANERLDREKQAEYHLKAHILDRTNDLPLEQPSKFRIIVYDINDNAPVFVHKVFNGSVQEMSPVGTSVTTITAVDADDPTVHGHADVSYKVIQGQEYFTIDNSGTIRTAKADLDREQKASYTILVKAVDGMGLHSIESGTATVRISLIDINDNFPVFKNKSFSFQVYENVREGEEVGRLEVEDIDEPPNRNTKFSIVHGPYHDTFSIEPRPITNEGIIRARKVLDYEKTNYYRFDVEATDGAISLPYSKTKGPKSIASVIIKILDVDEPPIFNQNSYLFEVQEESGPKKPIGFVLAVDPDKEKKKIRYRILRSKYFQISANGHISALKPLDREEMSWHNITVAANEINKDETDSRLETHVPVYIKVTDINDNAPVFAYPYEPGVCENSAPGKVILTISATDKDEMTPQVKFTYSLTSEESNFTLIDNRDNTANVTVKYGQFNRELVKTHYLPIVISDNGSPRQSSTNTLTIRVCKCNEEGEFTFCEQAAKQTGVSVQALIAILICIVTIIVIMVLIALRKRQKKDLNVLRKNVPEIHEQLVAYDEEGGGEMDTTSYDVSVLNSVRQGNMTSPRMTMEARPCMYPYVQKTPGNLLSGPGEMGVMIEMKKGEADNDGDLLPYDTLHIYGYEGAESIAESLSSLGSGSSDSDIDYDFLNDWGPRFKMLAELYGLESSGDLVY
uniref:Cadherin-5 n=1 Tax=Salvator merianae TaxID=96440 RepID=A0A8D0BWY7_SALMN